MKNSWIVVIAPWLLTSCAPLRNSPHDEKHQWELKLHEVQTNLDDLKHDINCFQTEIQILDGRIKYYENALTALKQQDSKIEQMGRELHLLKQQLCGLEKVREGEKGDLGQLSIHANETGAALAQFKTRIQELEQGIVTQNRRFEELAKVKGNIDAIAKSLKIAPFKLHKVKLGETLEKIATAHHTKVDRIKKLNELNNDLIVVGQELKIPTD
jgi:LysM repeat protein